MSSSSPSNSPASRLLTGFLGSILLLAGLAGCEPPHPIPPLVPQSTARSSLSCVQLETSLGETAERLPPTAALLWFEFQNQCDTAVRMDWRALKVTGVVSRWKEGATPEQDDEEEIIGPVPLVLVKPTGVEDGRLDARSKGHEAMRFDVRLPDRAAAPEAPRAPSNSNERKRPRRHHRFDADARLMKVCVDLSSVAELRPTDTQTSFCIEVPERHATTAVEDASTPSPNAPYYNMYDSRYRFEDHNFGGEWNTLGFPKLTVDTGITVHSMALKGHEFSSGNFKVDGSQIGDRLYAGTFDLRTKGYIAGPFYLGVEFGFGLGGSRRTVLVDQTTGQTKPLTAEASGLLTGSVFSGISGRVGIAQPFAEIGAGGQGVLYTINDSSGSDSSKSKISSWWGTVTPRGGVDFWIHPNLTLGAYGGVDALRTDSWFMGIRFSAHLRALDGR